MLQADSLPSEPPGKPRFIVDHTPDIAESLGGEGFHWVEERLRGRGGKLSRVSLALQEFQLLLGVRKETVRGF